MKRVLILAALIAAPVVSAQTNGLPPLVNQKDWVFIPYVGYDLQQHTVGWGGAALYQVNTNLWTGFRAENFPKQQTVAGVQGQLQANLEFEGVQFHPFIETTVGLGKDSLYGSGGTGAYVGVASWQWGTTDWDTGAIADYEHYVDGSSNGDKAYGGIFLHFTFP